MMKRMAALLVVLVAVSACGDDEKGDDLTLVERCVRDTEALYEKHDLPFSTDESERPGICEKHLAENDITTAAEWEILRRQIDKELGALPKP